MYLRLLNESLDTETNQIEQVQQKKTFYESIVNTITNGFRMLCTVIFDENILANKFRYDKVLSDQITFHFSQTNIDIKIIENDKNFQDYVFLNNPDEFIVRINSLFARYNTFNVLVYIFTRFISGCIILINIFNNIYLAIKQSMNKETPRNYISIDKNTKVITSNIRNISVYISDQIVNNLTETELEAYILSKIYAAFTNDYVFNRTLIKLLPLSVVNFLFFDMRGKMERMHLVGTTESIYSKFQLSMIFIMFFVWLLYLFLISKRNEHEIELSNDLAITMGIQDELVNALTKLKSISYNKDYSKYTRFTNHLEYLMTKIKGYIKE